jgi:methionine-rich copper-binding protein CopC
LDSDVRALLPIIVISGLIARTTLAPASALAHAFPTAEQPLVGSTVDAPPSRVTIDYDAPIESLFAKLQVLDGGGQDQAAGPPEVGKDRRHLSVNLKPLAQGDYTVKWSVVAEDGHRTEGAYVFSVAGGASR